MSVVWYSKNLGVLTPKEQKLLFKKKILVCGGGGIGGIIIELLLRAGVSNLALIDFDKFELTNLNRQIHSCISNLGLYKVDVIKKHSKSINPKINFLSFKKKLDLNSFSFYKEKIKSFKPDLIIDSFDNAASRMLIYRIAKDFNIPYLYAACAKARGLISIFLKNSNMEKTFNLPSYKANIKKAYQMLLVYPPCPAAWGPITNLIGCLATNAALNFLLKKEGFVIAPYYWVIEPKEKEIVTIAKF
ncbi:MAG: ThiF family adenylyltransferase [Candidatus Omnitrophica bacterium]|nr:ThiF family adenylyltransferase [Candidatus Omnitrophota bacterium]